MSTAKTARWLDLVAYLLRHHWPVTREEVFQHVGGYDGEPESARRKFERDKDELRALGIEIETVPLRRQEGDEPASGYQLRPRGAYLPYFELTDAGATERPYRGLDRLALSAGEVGILDRATQALAQQAGTPLAQAAASARRKLAFDLPLERETVERILALPLPRHAQHSLAVLQEALVERVAVACRYYTMSRGVEGDRVIEPWGLLFQWSRWYCVGLARDRTEPRLFRVDRMRDTRKLLGTDAAFQVPDGFDVRDYAGRSPWEFGEGGPVVVAVRFGFPESRWVVNRGVGRDVSGDDSGAAVLEFQVRDTDAFLRWLLSFGRQAEIVEPAGLGESLAGLRAEVAALYADATP